MATFTRTFITIETTAGEFLRERITTPDQLQYERTARANGWTPEKNQGETNLFMAWHSLKRTGQIDITFDEFKDYAIDVQVDSQKVDTDTGLEVEPGDPTR